MGDLVAASDSISPLTAILWCFYPMAVLVLVELLLRSFNDDDDEEMNDDATDAEMEDVS